MAGGFWAQWRAYLLELSVTVVIAIMAFAIDGSGVGPSPISFFERDATMSYQLTRPETVPLGLLIVISIVVPIGVLVAGTIAEAVLSHFSGRRVKLAEHAVQFGYLLLALAQALLVTKLVTDVIKIATGRQRPNFFALCDYKGYQAAVATNNYTSYWASTTAGVRGDVAFCAGAAFDVRQAQMSFPSGHSSNAFAGLFFTALYLRALFGVRQNHYLTWLSLLAAAPLVLAGWCAISRVRDRWHDTTDISVGAFIGIVGAWWAWTHYGRLQRSHFAVVQAAHAADVEAEERVMALSAASSSAATSSDARGLKSPLHAVDGGNVTPVAYGAAPTLSA